ncbi:MAG: hypothetical protein RBS22_01270 [Spongiibacteraceae bacterium]|jgi:hypothetical protein|nr:hypothetical protein [Spongiibacteraceae bacterium]
MPESKLFLFIAIEMMALLVIVCLALLFRMRGLHRFIKALEDRIRALRDSLRSSRSEARQAQARLAARAAPKGYREHIEDQRQQTLEQHQRLAPDRDIALDIAAGLPAERQAVALRHAYLVAEQEAAESDESSWDVLQARLIQLLGVVGEAARGSDGGPGADDEGEGEGEAEGGALQDQGTGEEGGDALVRLQKQVHNLERFRQLYFAMERKWEDVKAQAEDCQRQLTAAARDLGADHVLHATLARYAETVGEMDRVIQTGKALSDARGLESDDRQRPSIGKLVIANQEEIQRLRNMSVDQHKMIVALKKRLIDAKTLEAKDTLIAELTQQLERQQRFMQEADTCTQLLEEELNRTIEDNHQLRLQLADQGESEASGDAEAIAQLEALVGDLTGENRTMLATLAALETENRELRERSVPGPAAVADDSALELALKSTQQKLLNLQTQHIELEERYLELKTQQRPGTSE